MTGDILVTLRFEILYNTITMNVTCIPGTVCPILSEVVFTCCQIIRSCFIDEIELRYFATSFCMQRGDLHNLVSGSGSDYFTTAFVSHQTWTSVP